MPRSLLLISHQLLVLVITASTSVTILTLAGGMKAPTGHEGPEESPLRLLFQLESLSPHFPTEQYLPLPAAITLL
jgi:hypothetical protein